MSGRAAKPVKAIEPGSFEPEDHFYPRVLNSSIHPLVASFFRMDNSRIIKRYCHLHPMVKPEDLEVLLRHKPGHFRWAGCDTFNVTTTDGGRTVAVIETNSCPSGQKSFPLLSDTEEMGGYKRLLQSTFNDLVADAEDLPEGVLAVVYDKNPMEASGYAATLAELGEEHVFLTEFYVTDPDPPVVWQEGVMYIRVEDETLAASGTAITPPDCTSDAGRFPPKEGCSWVPVRAAFRYVTQKPWTRFPIFTRTRVLNPILPCLAGGRNKLVASKAYEIFNHRQAAAGRTALQIHTPETIHDVRKAEVPLWVERFGGQAVVKVPYSNAGQGVYTILTKTELDAFMSEEYHYDKFIVQSLIGSSTWGSVHSTEGRRYYHVGTMPDKRNKIFVADVRMMVSATSTGFQPLAVYARRAHKPLVDDISSSADSWSMLGTNLSVAAGDQKWDTETNRLLLMDSKDFNKLGISVDDLIEAYIQTVMATIAIDDMCGMLVDEDSAGATTFNMELFSSLNDDEKLLAEIHTSTVAHPRHAAAAEGEEEGVGDA